MTQQMVLKVLKSRYEKKYLSPLLSNFPKPIILFDDKQIRLKKQIDSLVNKIDSSTICPECNGRGTVFETNDSLRKSGPLWNVFSLGSEIDNRAIKINMCMTCCGDGLVFKEDQNNGNLARNGDLVKYDNRNRLLCQTCRQRLSWVFNEDPDNPGLEAYCHGRLYRLNCEIFSVSVNEGD